MEASTNEHPKMVFKAPSKMTAEKFKVAVLDILRKEIAGHVGYGQDALSEVYLKIKSLPVKE